ncbi:peptide-N(4)-(N-acetyl-beta-glucosaminyl)asparagine amidase-like [Centruroides sculpturatus]|uniref:peptide-N(4)-(N-acetyl-beta- glucosaminyl)asparagine amidase-like n=1 Tax=Centruroides sculpturatus TaxID=218467 RepID=UPI000C6E881E|nr:peptide-N(4)-(N-acetyl-beta-glucosaminyl)asparagine amidase-like [Centruroides sculpturatus]XP_023217045.1 peptide-N(4)-(N-acetyl-beta-glucosaminyl)asparagine amidase-like [Centruroides sculpturatus]
MSEQEESIALLLNDNSPSEFLKVSKLLLFCCEDLMKNPQTSPYRSIKVESNLFQDEFLPFNGAVQCLFSLGYREGIDSFVLPEPNLNTLRKFRNHLTSMRQKCLKESEQLSTDGNPSVTSHLVEKSSKAVSNSRDELMKHSEFFSRLNSSVHIVLLYEDPALQREAIKCVPVTDLQNKAKEKYSMIVKQSEITDISIQDCLLIELLFWFKFNFFTWVDTVKCKQCRNYCVQNGMFSPTNEDLHWLADRIEKHTCKICNISYRFPRYSHPRQLLITRSGRCGEWANCFTFLCRALGFDSRLISDWTDHAWTEVYSVSRARWIHCDPCENACDTPLVYESGWGKKINYIMAFSKDEVQDVTWRYTAKPKEVLSRRTLCNEDWLLQQIFFFTNKLQNRFSKERKTELLHRKIRELVEFLSTRTAKDEELIGRTSGSLDWRLARSEIKLDNASKSFVFYLEKSEAEKRYFHVKYSSALDKYVRVSNQNEETYGWKNCVYEEHNIFYKQEHDWKMVYLARTKGSQKADVSWKFDFCDKFLVDTIILQCDYTCFENASVSVRIITDDKTILLNKVSGAISTRKIQGVSKFTLYCILEGGKGENAWQHSQLFRQPMNSKDFPFEIQISFL